MELQRDLQTTINHFAFVLTMFTKYEDLLNRLALSGKPEQMESLKSIGWLIFILARIHILHRKNEIVECVCLLIAVISFLLTNAPKSIKINNPSYKDEEQHEGIRRLLCEIVKLKNIEAVITIEEALANMFQQLKQEDVIKASTGEPNKFEGMLEGDRIYLNLKKLNAQYQQRLSPDEIDERIFLGRGSRVVTPLKFTPFARQGFANKGITPVKPDADMNPLAAGRQLQKSKRMLNYDIPNAAKENVTMATKLKEIKFSQYATQSPYAINKLPAATPITRAMEMNNWLQDHVNKAQIRENGLSQTMNTYLGCSPEPTVIKTLEDTLKKLVCALGQEKHISMEDKGIDSNVKKTQIKCQQIRGIYFRIADELICLEEKRLAISQKGSQDSLVRILKNPNYHKSVLAAATEIVLFVHNSMAIMFEQILDLCEVSAFEFWKILRPLLKFDSAMPGPLRMHFQQIEVKILTSLAWQRNSPIHLLISKIIAQEKQEANRNAIRIESTFTLGKEESVSCVTKNTPMKDIHIDAKEEQKDKQINIDCISLELYNEDLLSNISSLELTYDLFFQRVLHIVSSKILLIAEILSITDDQVKENIWEAMKHCLSVEPELFINRHIDQLLLCTIYAICKMMIPNKYSFNSIISHYIDLHAQASENITPLFFNIKIDEHKTLDIIGFYNHIYIIRMKTAICSICHPPDHQKLETSHTGIPTSNLCYPTTNKKKIRALAPNSPLTASLPPAALQYPFAGYSKTVIGNSSCYKFGSPLPGLTPRTKALYAYGESPAVAKIASGKGNSGFTPSLVSDRKVNFKENLRSQIMLIPKGPQNIVQSHAGDGKIKLHKNN